MPSSLASAGCTSLSEMAIRGTRQRGLVARGLLVIALSCTLVLSGCGQESPSPAAEQTPADESTPEADESSTEPQPEVVEESLTPEECTFPEVQISGEPTFPLLHGTVERSQVQGVSFLLTTASPTEEPASLEITRRVVGCVGTASVEVPADATISVLGLNLQVSEVRTAIDVPNRAAVTITVIEDEE